MTGTKRPKVPKVDAKSPARCDGGGIAQARDVGCAVLWQGRLERLLPLSPVPTVIPRVLVWLPPLAALAAATVVNSRTYGSTLKLQDAHPGAHTDSRGRLSAARMPLPAHSTLAIAARTKGSLTTITPLTRTHHARV